MHYIHSIVCIYLCLQVFRYYFYEKWAALYSTNSLLLITDFRDVFFQSNPFTYNLDEWHASSTSSSSNSADSNTNPYTNSYDLVLYQEFYPTMLIKNCAFNSKVMSECYGEDATR
jgi:hypothetical protein